MSWDTERFYLQEPPAQIADKDGLLWIWREQTSPEYLLKLARELGPPLSAEEKAELEQRFKGVWRGDANSDPHFGFKPRGGFR
jgi:hypothetical protein